jgi:hypothetical protein
VLAVLLAVWGVLELAYRSLLGDVSRLDTRPEVHLEPQARQTVLTLMFGQRELSGTRLAGWTVPIWRFFDPPFQRRFRLADGLDLAMRLASSQCRGGPDVPMPKLKQHLREMAHAVWIARHWDEERMIDAWASCLAEQLATCGERIPPSASTFDAVHLWAHDTGVGPCKERWVNRRSSAASEALWLEAPDLQAEIRDEMQICPAPHAGEMIP